MLAHEVEETQFPLPDERGNIENSWAVHQLYTTADFGRENKLLSFLCGGLNFQVEHHLFPRICHTHYKPISDIVKKTAEEYSLRYNANPSFRGAILSHIRFLKKLGKYKTVAYA
jgi:linoleoyl-CoA desaturase